MNFKELLEGLSAFVDALLQRDVLENDVVNAHFTPTSALCDVCANNFTHVLKFENLGHEAQEFGLAKGFEVVKAETNLKAALKFFSTLRSDQKRKLYQMFFMDLKLFNYDPKNFL